MIKRKYVENKKDRCKYERIRSVTSSYLFTEILMVYDYFSFHVLKLKKWNLKKEKEKRDPGKI